MLYLKELGYEDAINQYRFLVDFKSENGFENPAYGLSFKEYFNSFIGKRLLASSGVGLKDGYVPDTYYFLYDNDTIVGLFKVRHYLNDFLRNGSGHIGYGIKSNYRNKGYGTKGLKLAIDKLVCLRGFDNEDIHMSCNIENKASLQVMLNNKGQVISSDNVENYVQIKLSDVISNR